MIDRRAAVQRISLMFGGALSTQLTSALMGEVTNTGDSVDVTEAMEALLAEVADVIIPETDTPGAKEAGAHEFIIRVMRDCYELEPQQKFYAGLARIDERSQAAYQKTFVELTRPEQIEIIMETAKKDKGYFKQVKQLTQVGYFSSELGITTNLQYMPIPGRFEGDVPYEKGQGVIMNMR
ncbi:MAG: gluconate 2-dehydrogenase subunit 3 family protein [Verrucomicrobiales bacterium]|nr:gluconate 2-dehydrogenase subunit 3 family protein [Verrucomicrobiales bacterium]